MIRYDVIAKMETFSEDTQFTLSQAGLEGKLTQSEVAALFKKYQLDFELYGYDPEPYFDLAIVDR